MWQVQEAKAKFSEFLGKSEDLFEDAMLAATARIYRLTVATRNLRDFAHFDAPIFNPFTYSNEH
jgi:predicted nucleic acid-binding protein